MVLGRFWLGSGRFWLGSGGFGSFRVGSDGFGSVRVVLGFINNVFRHSVRSPYKNLQISTKRTGKMYSLLR